MIVMIDGPDNTGKTTLAKELEARGFRYLHFSVPPPGINLFALYAKTIAEAALQPEDTVIDRLHPAEYAYGKTVRGNARVTFDQVETLNRLILEAGGLIVMCSAQEGRVMELWRARREQEYVKEEGQMRQIIGEYDLLHRLAVLCCGRPGRVLHYDFTEHIGRAGEFAEKIIGEGRNAQEG